MCLNMRRKERFIKRLKSFIGSLLQWEEGSLFVALSVHMAWMRTICGRLEIRYRYSANIVYNNFPWPEVCFNTETQRLKDTEEKLPLSLSAFVPLC